ncbi:LmbE family protein [Leptobacterium flavescens]|uniref:LmbE family protein n=1 Tax=Leptobacterium flavescens TaxID=472055 RepID=A0A6P0UUD2_9FLAO|nr:PIG-L family deacetylase [Leptobacterium flavescens]NER14036.1 LmbE family protein [Leptobacterium flavescens]
MRKSILLLIIFLFNFSVQAQAPKKLSSTEIYEAVQKLNFLGTALYIAAHPDDENTRLIAYLANNIKARTTYLSLTRGDGGQNLIGTELRELLGVLRTEELLAARRVDGGEQLFTRANDFGFSKHPDETLSIWDKDAVLSDVVLAIRKLKPDVIINRFNHRTPGTTHGHHTTSAILSVEAFDIVNDKNVYPEQLKYVDTWQPKRLFFNTGWWFYGSRENFDKADKTNLVSVDVGVYYPLKGLSNNEIASIASSQHLCQGFGRVSFRGSQEEWVELLKGDAPKDKTNLFEGINTTWTRVKGGQAVKSIMDGVEKNFNFNDPSSHLPELLKAYDLIQKLENKHWRDLKSKEIKRIIEAVTGLYLEAVANQSSAAPGEKVTINLEALNRSSQKIVLKSVELSGYNQKTNPGQILQDNKRWNERLDFSIAADAKYTAPYWLESKGSLGTYKVDDIMLRGLPETPRAISVRFTLQIGNTDISFDKDLVFKYGNPAKGEIYEPFEILPPATASMADKVTIFADANPREFPVKIKAGKSNLNGTVSLSYPAGWKVSPERIDFSIAQKGDEKTVVFTVSPPDNESEGYINPVIETEGRNYSKELIEINYDHIPKQSVLLPSEAKVVRLNIEKAGENIGYIVGAGDGVPESLKQIGYNVVTIQPEDIEEGTLEKYDAIVVGIRAYNVVQSLRFKQKFLLEYVNDGGNLIIQYNTARRNGLGIDNLAPYDLQLSRDRVTDENAEVRLLAKKHSLLNFPNKIQETDFDGWVQERGLYFPNKWGSEFTAVLSMNDKGENAKDGSLLVAPYGKGHYIYTGLSFFRELPAGVPGAYKLFANMLSIGKTKIEKRENIKG